MAIRVRDRFHQFCQKLYVFSSPKEYIYDFHFFVFVTLISAALTHLSNTLFDNSKACEGVRRCCREKHLYKPSTALRPRYLVPESILEAHSPSIHRTVSSTHPSQIDHKFELKTIYIPALTQLKHIHNGELLPHSKRAHQERPTLEPTGVPPTKKKAIVFQLC